MKTYQPRKKKEHDHTLSTQKNILLSLLQIFLLINNYAFKKFFLSSLSIHQSILEKTPSKKRYKQFLKAIQYNIQNHIFYDGKLQQKVKKNQKIRPKILLKKYHRLFSYYHSYQKKFSKKKKKKFSKDKQKKKRTIISQSIDIYNLCINNSNNQKVDNSNNNNKKQLQKISINN
eukprot:TRINITY_DN6343_c0_g1_i3.p3 TRINITY_DN6343_c0_g1~~TRINITY_DN6343_c0_g1_i3.p3  ORF type:complete len:174 (+),score=10.45 TRINITY_DN6343_c0_g1_i3:560-1081(+)